jgi:hypothetical protein
LTTITLVSVHQAGVTPLAVLTATNALTNAIVRLVCLAGGYGDSLLFILSSGQIMYGYVMRPDSLQPRYIHNVTVQNLFFLFLSRAWCMYGESPYILSIPEV